VFINIFLDCSNYESTKNSVAEIFGIDPVCLIDFLKSISANDDQKDFLVMMYFEMCNRFGMPKCNPDVVWFHGTRVKDKKSFYIHGILPKKMAREKIESVLLPLAEGVEKKGVNPLDLSQAGKCTEADEGPFSVLFKLFSINKIENNHCYADIPEMVEDIAGQLVGENLYKLVEKYKEITSSYVVSFLDDTKTRPDALYHALWFLFLVATGTSELEAVVIANTCFDSGGKLISPDKIKKIEACCPY
jgi:hypothetical protein